MRLCWATTAGAQRRLYGDGDLLTETRVRLLVHQRTVRGEVMGSPLEPEETSAFLVAYAAVLPRNGSLAAAELHRASSF